MKTLIKNTLVSVFILFSTYVQATIEEYSQGGLMPGSKTYIYDGNCVNTPHLIGEPSKLTNFTVDDDIRVANQYLLGAIEEKDLSANGVLDWRYIFTSDGNSVSINGYFDNYKQGNINFVLLGRRIYK